MYCTHTDSLVGKQKPQFFEQKNSCERKNEASKTETALHICPASRNESTGQVETQFEEAGQFQKLH
jgi:hypothetical protein